MMQVEAPSKVNVRLVETKFWEALVNRDSSAEGKFVYAVKTTGVYCRPSCPSRLPNRDNVLFFKTPLEAEKLGFRACKRCRPNSASKQEQQAEVVAKICKQIQESDVPLTLDTMAQSAGLSPHHFLRVFKKIVGLTPKQFAIAHRTKQVRKQLHENATVTQAIYEAGFETTSNFYDQSDSFLGMKPSQYQQGAGGITIRYTVQSCWLGLLLIAATTKGICSIAFGDSDIELTSKLRADFSKAQFIENDQEFDSWVAEVLKLIESPHQLHELPLDIQGTAFQQIVWHALRKIKPGTTVSYADMAKKIGNSNAVRAIANACATNQIAVAIPCHRVIGSDGSLKGYRWGPDRKKRLLAKEAEFSEKEIKES
jgi:AraC family transcriptional regulator, regulatory protein of adaptative response / methylated-DNA-[protein]-cysteine methyltransferase